MSKPLIEPRTLKGFRDFLPDRMMVREQILETARRVYRSYGFAPIDTPALEHFEILAGKGSEETDRQMYHFRDAGERHVGMRFDLTVPLARFVSQHAQTLGLPFKRYHMATVWRGESPQAGRYREFMQCDYDTIGTTSLVSDIETILVAHDLIDALGIERFRVRVNNRKLLEGLIQQTGLGIHTTAVLRSIDKLPKASLAIVADEIATETGISREYAADMARGLAAVPGESIESALDRVAGMTDENGPAQQGLDELRLVVAGALAAGVPRDRLQVDLTIARGLDYYTGTILETFLDELPGIGSICSGGRYDNLTQMFSRTPMPGIGASLGLDRLIAALEELGRCGSRSSPASVLIVQFSPEMMLNGLQLAAELRRAGLNVEVYPEPKKVGMQLKYADRKGIGFAIIQGPDELAEGIVQVKQLASGQQIAVPVGERAGHLAGWLKKSLAGGELPVDDGTTGVTEP